MWWYILQLVAISSYLSIADSRYIQMTVPRVSSITRLDCNRNLLEETDKTKLPLVFHPTLRLQFLKISFFSLCCRNAHCSNEFSTQSMCYFLFSPIGAAVYFKEKMTTTAQRLVDYYQWVIENGGKYTELLHPYLSQSSLCGAHTSL